jgi:hypothetical protein
LSRRSLLRALLKADNRTKLTYSKAGKITEQDKANDEERRSVTRRLALRNRNHNSADRPLIAHAGPNMVALGPQFGCVCRQPPPSHSQINVECAHHSGVIYKCMTQRRRNKLQTASGITNDCGGRSMIIQEICCFLIPLRGRFEPFARCIIHWQERPSASSLIGTRRYILRASGIEGCDHQLSNPCFVPVMRELFVEAVLRSKI